MPRSPILLGTSTERERVMRAAVARVVIGAAFTLLPGLSQRMFRIPPAQDSSALRLVARLFGIRNVALGAWAMKVQDQGPEVRRFCYQLNAAVDALDVVALGIAAVAGDDLVQGALMGSALGTCEVLAWLDLVGDVDRGAESEAAVALA